MATGGNDSPICPLCEAAIAEDCPVYLSHGELVHVDCLLATARHVQVVEAFLQRRAGHPFCHSCVALATGMTQDLVGKAIARLRLRSMFRVRPATCTLCDRTRVAVLAERIAERPDRPFGLR
jgi:hypothetical protein